jgi:serine protease Do
MEDNDVKLYPTNNPPEQGSELGPASEQPANTNNQNTAWQQPYTNQNYYYPQSNPYNNPNPTNPPTSSYPNPMGGYQYGYGAADGGSYQPSTQPTQPKKKKGWVWLGIAAGLILIALLGMLTYFLITNNNTATNVTSSATTSQTAPAATVVAAKTTVAALAPSSNTGTSTSNQGTLTVSQIAEQVRPAVVQITSQQNIDTTNPFFGSSSSSSQVETGIGSGVIYDKTGYILTNYHVIEGANSLLVTLPDGRSFDGKVVGGDSLTDLAVVKIDPNGDSLPVATLGDSSALKVGDGVVAIGNALGLPGGPTVTSGVVSALDRSVTEPGSSNSSSPFGSSSSSGPQLYGMIQTDAAINPGNSGGPLVNMQGQVIGINTLVAGQAESGVQAQGIGFAISINQAKEIGQQLVTNGKASHPFMGISYQPLTTALAKSLNLDSSVKSGAVVMQVQSGSPASQAGLKRGDVITAIDGQQIVGESKLGEIINTHKPGDKLTLTVVSTQTSGGNGQTRTVQLTLAERTTS